MAPSLSHTKPSNNASVYVIVDDEDADQEVFREEVDCSLEEGREEVLNSSRHSTISLDDVLPSLKKSTSEDNATEGTCEVSASSEEGSHDRDDSSSSSKDDDACDNPEQKAWLHDVMWLIICFVGIMVSFVAYGILLEYTTSGDKKLAELPFLMITSILGGMTAYTGRAIKKEAIADIPHKSTLLLGLMSLGSTFCAIRALRYVIFPIQVLARSCKPVPVMLIGALLGKKYPTRKYINVMFIVVGVALFMGGGRMTKDEDAQDLISVNNNTLEEAFAYNTTANADYYINDSGSNEDDSNIDYYTMFSNPHHLLDRAPLQHSHEVEVEGEEPVTLDKQIFGILLLLASLCFDGGTGAYEDKLMSVQKVEPFDLMFKFQLSKSLLSALAVLLLGEVPALIEMLQDSGVYIVALGMCSAIGQVFIFICISKFGALTTSLMSLTRKVTTLTASIVIFGHGLTAMQVVGLAVSLGAMLMNSFKPKRKDDTKTLTRIPNKSANEKEELQPIV